MSRHHTLARLLFLRSASLGRVQAAAACLLLALAICVHTPQLVAQSRPLPRSTNSPTSACPSFARAGHWGWRVRALGGVGQPQVNSAAAPAGLADYQAFRDSTTDFRPHYLGGVRAEFVHQSGLFLRAGVGYQLYRSRVKFRGPSFTTETLTEIRDPMSGVRTRVDTTRITGYRSLEVNNRQQAASFAAGFGYQLQGHRLRPYVLAEAEYAFLIASQGQLIRPNELTEDLSLDSDYLIQRPSTQFSLHVGADFSISRTLDLGLSIYHRGRNALRGEGDPLDFRQNLNGLAVNVVYYPQ